MNPRMYHILRICIALSFMLSTGFIGLGEFTIVAGFRMVAIGVVLMYSLREFSFYYKPRIRDPTRGR